MPLPISALGRSSPKWCVSLWRHRRTVGRVGHHPDRYSCEVCRHVLCHPRPCGAKEALGDVAHVRGDDDVVERSEGVLGGKWLTVENIETGTGEVAGAEGLDQGLLFDDRTAGDVHQN